MSTIEGGTRFRMIESYRNGMMDHFVGQSDFVAPDTYYLGVSLTEIDEEGGNVSEPLPSSGYERIPLKNPEDWTKAEDGIISNVNEIRMNEVQIDSGIANYWFLSESADGDAIGYAALDYARPMVIYSTIIIEPNELKIYIPH